MVLSPSKLVSLHCIVIANPPTSAVDERSVEDEGRRGRTLMKRLSSMILFTMEERTYPVELSSLMIWYMIIKSNFPF